MHLNRQLLLTTLLALMVRWLFLDHHVLWFDEMASVFIAKLPTGELIKAIATDTHPPLYFIVLKYWRSFGKSIIFSRIISLVFGVLATYVGYFVFRKLTNKKIAILASIFMAVSPLQIYYSVEIRMYSLLTLETLLLTFVYTKLLQSKNGIYYFLFTFLSVISLYTHYYASVIIFTLIFLLLRTFRKNKIQLQRLFISMITLFLSFLPWLFLINKNQGLHDCWCFPAWIALPTTFMSFLVGGVGLVTIRDIFLHAPIFHQLVYLISIMFIISVLLASGIYSDIKKTSKVAVLLYVPLVLVTFISLFIPIFSPRAFIIISPYFYLILSKSVNSYRKANHRHLFSLILVSIFLAINSLQFFSSFYKKPAPNKDYITPKNFILYNQQK